LNFFPEWRYRKGVRRVLWTLAGLLAVTALSVAVAHAQIWAGGYGRTPPRFATATTFQGGFNFCRMMFNSDHREKQGWSTDYPGADINFSIRVAELTKINVTMQKNGFSGGGDDPEPEAVVVRLTDDALFQCPMLFMEDGGTARFSDIEVQRLQDYLLKGGFLLSMDYHGTYGQEQFDEEMGRVLPRAKYPIVSVMPPDHVMWKSMFTVTQLPQMASIQTWRRTGDVIERWNENGAPPDARAIVDPQGRIMVLMIHNTVLPDPWEREGEDKDYFYKFSPDAYAAGIDILLYAMTH